MQTKAIRRLSAVALLGALAVGATTLALSDSNPTPCPGTILCPQTGETICADRCPLTGDNADDCPGTIVCPLTGETTCKDRCPVEGEEPAEPTTRACCAAPQD